MEKKTYYEYRLIVIRKKEIIISFCIKKKMSFRLSNRIWYVKGNTIAGQA